MRGGASFLGGEKWFLEAEFTGEDGRLDRCGCEEAQESAADHLPEKKV
jgi:hypothetical protein